MENITASIVIYQSDPATVMRAAQSFLSNPMAGQLFIIDNSPTDNARESFKDIQVNYIFCGKNLGYGKAHNLAITQCLQTSRYHLVLNPDVYFGPDVLQKLFYFMEGHTLAGLVMPKVLYPDGTLQRLCKLLPTPLNLAARRFLPVGGSLLKRINDSYEMSFSQYDKMMNVPFLSGCFMFMRTAALKKTGLFDERFFLYAEDTDLSRRIHQQFKTIYFPGAEIYHTHARGSYKNLRHLWYNLKSATQYFNKWGWFFDEERRITNEIATQSFAYRNNYGPVIMSGPAVAQRSMNE